MSFTRLLRISRPRFWLYEAGTFLVGVAAAYAAGVLDPNTFIALTAFFLYFLFPANLYIYGINDIYDYETDKLNPKKVAYEALVMPDEHAKLWLAIFITTIPFIVFLYASNFLAVLGFIAFLFFAAFYSAPPIRAKAVPGLDSIFSAGHYVATGAFAYVLAGGTSIAAVPLIAAMAWAIAMHAYSAIPDIAADKAANVPTIATALGKNRTILLCTLLYALAAALSFPYLTYVAVGFGALYIVLMLLSYRTQSEQTLFALYTLFPYVNALGGMAMFFTILLG